MGKEQQKDTTTVTEVEEVTIEEHIDTHYRDFSHYVLSHRGIPSKYDGLTSVQRTILLSASKALQGTTSLIGDCFKNGYHHGDASLAGAINRMCRTFDNSHPLLYGDGFFGNSLYPAASERYTKCSAHSEISKMIEKYSQINEFDHEGNCKFINLDAPIGLCTFIVGIGIGYRSQILPRKLDDILKYLDGENTQLKPWFAGFGGDIQRNPSNKKAWLISSKVNDEKERVLRIWDLPPMMRYDTFYEKLVQTIEESFSGRVMVTNRSKERVNIELSMNKNTPQEEFERLRSTVESLTSISVPENFVFADGDGIVEYDSIKDYLDDFRVFRNISRKKKMEYELSELEFEKDYDAVKSDFINFIKDKFGSKNANELMENVLKDLSTLQHRHEDDFDDPTRIRERLKRIPAHKVNSDEMTKCREHAKELTQQTKEKREEIRALEKNEQLDLSSTKAKNLLTTSTS